MPTKVEKLNSHSTMATKVTPASPKWKRMAVCSSAMPCRPSSCSAGASSMIIAVQLQITMVSMNTPKAWNRPALTGWLTSEAAAAQGAEPLPASLENRPRCTPFISAAPKPPATTWRRPKASSTMRRNTLGIRRMFFPMTKIVSRK